MRTKCRHRVAALTGLALLLLGGVTSPSWAIDPPKWLAGQERTETVQVAGSPLLFFELAKAGSGPSNLEIHVLLDEQSAVRETIGLPASLPERVALEVLAYNPAERELLRGLEKLQPGRVRVAIWLDGGLLEEMPLRDFEARSKRVFMEPVTPIAVPRKVEILAQTHFPKLPSWFDKGMVPDPTCAQRCDDERVYCWEAYCDPRAGGCDQCDAYYDGCIVSCPLVCVDPREVYTYTTNQYMGTTYSPATCMRLSLQATSYGYLHQSVTNLYKRTKYRRTVNCNGSYSDQVIEVTYTSSQPCWTRVSNSTCSPQLGWATPVCG